MGRPSLSLAMIVKNEAENMPVLFESIKDCFDEIHVTDTGSTDGTVEVLQRLGAKVHHFDWVHDFAAARNASFEPVKTDFVMWMDGDDVLANPEMFKIWRQDVMHLADYWFAPYHYAHDDRGRPICTFLRERVFRTRLKPKWTYFVHEGVMPQPGAALQKVATWQVRHRRTAEDLAKDRSRNLDIFLKHKDKLDARMRYYFGKEYFENGRPFEASMELQRAIADPSLMLHDRILAMQYLCYAFMALNQPHKTLEMAHMGLMLAPHRAEFHCAVGDALIKQGRPMDAVPHYQAARFCNPNAMGVMGEAIFNSMVTYTSYPNTQLAQLYWQARSLDAAIGHAQESVLRFGDKQAEGILSQLLNMKELEHNYKNAKPCEDIVFTTLPQTAYEFDPGIAETKAMGGSETALIEMARELRKQSGRPVRIFSMRKEHKTFEGVDYIPVQALTQYMRENKPFMHIAWRHSMKVTDAPTFVWSHDLMTPGVEHTQNYDKVLCLTPFHKRYMMATQGVPEHKIHVTRNGIKPERFEGPMPEKDPLRFVFGSSPDRGLVRCMKVLDRVRKVYPQVNLHVHYGIEHLDKWGHAALRQQLEEMFAARKDWVHYHGATEQKALMESYKKSAYNVQPSDWIETSCISARELLYCGVYAMFRDTGGVSDTIRDAHERGGALLIDREGNTEADLDYYAERVIEAIKEERYKRVHADPKEWSWAGVAKQWLEELPELFRK